MISINSSYHGRELTLVKENAELNWDVNPVVLTSEQTQSINLDLVFSILRGDDLLPSSLAGLTQADINLLPTVRTINDIYIRSIEDYKRMRDFAFREDCKIISAGSTASYFPNLTIGALFGGIVGGAVGILFSGNPKIGAGIGLGLGGGAGYHDYSTKAKSSLALAGSTFRIRWMYQIETIEKIRLKNTKECLEMTCKPLLRELKALEIRGETCVQKLTKLDLISRVYSGCFPNQILEVDEIEVSNYALRLRALPN
ncbi:MAG: hypothetical protein H0V82_08285 [Candidatus Protochlamydia sp.]|nr:hypothetical protein [Candidatus Protochlamydia sp.]